MYAWQAFTKSPKGMRFARILTLAIPILTFLLGILAQQLLQDYLSKHDALTLGIFFLALTVGILGIVCGFHAWANSRDLATVVRAIEHQSEKADQTLQRLTISSGLAVEYVPDGGVGESYKRAAAEIKGARESLTFVDLWEPYDRYQSVPSDSTNVSRTTRAREEFYKSIIESLERHKESGTAFHRRVVQVPAGLLGSTIPFHVDPIFKEYLKHVVSIQESHPVSCRVRVSPAMIRTHFIIVDRRKIILPILSNDPTSQRQVRYGALFFDDVSGSLYSCLKNMYQVIESRSSVLDSEDLG